MRETESRSCFVLQTPILIRVLLLSESSYVVYRVFFLENISKATGYWQPHPTKQPRSWDFFHNCEVPSLPNIHFREGRFGFKRRA